MGNPGFWCMTYGDFVIFPKTDSETRAREMYKHVNFKFKYDHYLNWLGWNVVKRQKRTWNIWKYEIKRWVF